MNTLFECTRDCCPMLPCAFAGQAMKKYTRADISEQELEDLVRRGPELIEEGLVYVDHQKPAAGGRLDVLLVDSGRSLVVAELKVVQDDGMLVQGLDYYDYVSAHVEAFARLYKLHSIDPTQQVRLLLIAPTFSQNLVNRCKWLNLRVSLFTFNCLKFEGEADVVPVFTEQEVTEPPEPIHVARLEDSLNYITDPAVRGEVNGQNSAPSHSWSPDGQWIAAITEASGKPQLVKIKPMAGATPLPLPNAVPVSENYGGAEWSPAGDWILYPSADCMSLVSLPPVDLPASTDTIAGFSMHPDGQRFLTSIAKFPYDIWMLQGFDPPRSKTWIERLLRR